MHVFISSLEKLQFEYFNGRPEWTTIHTNDLKLFMAYSYFGYPKSKSENEQNIFELYEDFQKECITDMFKIIEKKFIKEAPKITVGFTIVHSICKKNCKNCVNSKEIFAHCWFLLRIKNSQSVVYIDIYHSRTYKDFNDYIQNNELPSGFIYFPKSGMYEENNYLVTELTPPSRKVESVKSTLDSVGKLVNCTGTIILTGGLFFTVMPSLLISSTIAVTSSCIYNAYRQISSLSNIERHNGSLVSNKAIDHWLNLGISIFGIITAPLSAASKLIEKESNLLFKTMKYGKSFKSFQKGLFIAQTSMELMRFTVNAINSKNITMDNLMQLRLDLFIVTGILQPPEFISEIIKVVTKVVLIIDRNIHQLITEIAYCVGQRIMLSPSFVKEHLKHLIDKLGKFVLKNLTMDKMLCAWKTFSKLMDEYRRQVTTLRGTDLLHHVVHDKMTLPCDDLDAKKALCGEQMTKLLNELDIANNRHAIECCVRIVIGIADEVREKYRDTVATLVDYEIINSEDIDVEFCKQYELSACSYAEFVMYGIKHTDQDVFWRAYNDRPKTVQDELRVANYYSGTQSLDTFITSVLPDGPSMSAKSCRDVAISIDPANRARYSKSEHLSLPDNTSVLCDITPFRSIRIVLFYVQSSSLNVSIYCNSDYNMLSFK